MKPPIILAPGKLEEINTYLLERTGCFAFLTSERKWQYSEPMTGKGAVELWSVALYAIYHDYGCRYLDFVLDSSNSPNMSIDDLLYKSRRHKRTIGRVLRTNVAHGILDSYSSERVNDIFFSRDNKPIEQISDEKWVSVAEKIRRESDDLVSVIYKWADEYNKSSSSIREVFGASDLFKKSIDSRIMFDSLDNDFCRPGEKRAKKILEEISIKAPNEKLNLWRDEISDLFLKKEIESPEDIINKLKTYLFNIHNPVKQSSVAIGDSTGYSLSSLL